MDVWCICEQASNFSEIINPTVPRFSENLLGAFQTQEFVGRLTTSLPSNEQCGNHNSSVVIIKLSGTVSVRKENTKTFRPSLAMFCLIHSSMCTVCFVFDFQFPSLPG